MSSYPLNLPAGEDIWSYVAAAVTALSTEQLQTWQKQIRQSIHMEEQAKARHNLQHLPGWAGRCGRPTLALITITLLLRGTAPTF